ncbi:hypothetical protein D9613_012459 [Agrocybe pediades]|uniref:NAD-P-binding protein n=1 Tax=Agrocybe pediades TaxID=84607 RepID=A0A8H4QR31_9AGAR|nr:hypothetical protein D9613_012459 [Agrocybe pediades]
MVWPFSSKERTSVSEDDLVDLRGKVVIVTGSNAGIGYSTVQFLARKGAKVYMAARNEEKGREAIKQLEAEDLWGGMVEWLKLDLSDIRQSKEAALEFLKKEKRLDILVNNAATVLGPYKQTSDGLLDIMVVNHISHFIFTTTLLPLMKQTAKEDSKADVRIINITSEGHQMVPLITTFAGEETLNKQYEESFMGYMRTYGYTKLANVLFTKELQRRLVSEGFTNIICISVHPGSVITPGLHNFTSRVPYVSWLTKVLSSWFSYSQRAGAYTSVFAAAAPEVKTEAEKYRGAYMVPVAKIAKASKHAEDERLAKELWETTEAKMKKLGVL